MKRAFTLVELLIVLGIIALLISLLMPALAAARQQAQTTQCLSNLRQLGMAAITYANSNKDFFPIARVSAFEEWDFRVGIDPVTGAKTLEPGILWTFNVPMKIQQCPRYDGPSPTVTDPFTGYNYNTSFIGHGVGEARTAPAKMAQIRRASEIALFGDGQYWGGTNKYMRAPVRESPLADGDSVSAAVRSAGTQGFRHRGATNVCYADGHAASVTDRFTQVSPGSAYIAPHTGFLSADNRAYDGRP